MIPKIAHFHWTGPEMSWLRWCSIREFKNLNPGWEIVLHDTPNDIREHGLKYHHEADWTWWRALYERGGFQVATDIVFLKPIPEEWLDCDFNVCTNGTDRVFQFAVMGATPGHGFLRECVTRAVDRAYSIRARLNVGHDDYQSLGTDFLGDICCGLPNGVHSFRLFDQPMDALCPVRCMDVPQLWATQPYEPPEESIGVHWYGGHETSRALEAEAEAGNFAISVLARR